MTMVVIMVMIMVMIMVIIMMMQVRHACLVTYVHLVYEREALDGL